MHNEDAMATEKLADGIRKFYADAASSSSTPRRGWPRRWPADRRGWAAGTATSVRPRAGFVCRVQCNRFENQTHHLNGE